MALKTATKDPLASRFERSGGLLKHRLIARSYGEVGTGKTHFWLTAPGPIVVQSFDQGLEGVALEQYALKDIYPIEYDWSPTKDLSQDDAIALRDTFIEDYEYALKHARTILWDKETDVWELFRYAQFGEPNDAPRNYPQLNQHYRKIVNMAKATDVNFGLIQGMKDEWITVKKRKASGEVTEAGAASGRRKSSGFGELDGLVHLNLFHDRLDGKMSITVGKARGPGGHDIQDQTFEDLSFAEFAQLVFPESDEGSWS